MTKSDVLQAAIKIAANLDALLQGRYQVSEVKGKIHQSWFEAQNIVSALTGEKRPTWKPLDHREMARRL